MLPKHIKTTSDLQTTHRATCEGFLEQAVAKVGQADPFVERAKKFYKALESTKTIDDVLALNNFKDELISASGFSDKAKLKFTPRELEDALRKVLEGIFGGSNRDFREELLYRYLLTRGDTLGGSMRNVTGRLASDKLTKLVKKVLKKEAIATSTTKSELEKVQSIAWQKRKLLFDKKPGFIDKNIDIILMRVESDVLEDRDLLKKRSNYLACGELKGGIDPAGADEHWKTANSALGRIRQAFPNKKPKLFFIGAAIEAAMAGEIFDQLRSGKLDHVANLTKQQQLEDLVDWLLSL